MARDDSITPQAEYAPKQAPLPLPQPESGSVKNLLPWLVAVAFFMESLDTTILNTAVPAISQALGVAPLSMKSVLASYTLSLAVFIPISGWMADRFGTRRVFSFAIAVFTLGSLLCGIASNVHVLVICRILQGMGGSMMVPVGRLTMVRTFPKSELVRAMSFVSIPSLTAPMLGPLLGGLIVHYLHWRVIFFVNIPIGIAGLLFVWRRLPDYFAPHPEPLDVVGLILFGSGISLLSYVLEIFGEDSLSTGEMLALLALALALLAGYGLHAQGRRFPLLDLALFRVRTFATAVSGSFITRIGMGGVPFLLPLLYQVGLGLTPVQSGLLIMPQALAALSTKFVLPRVLRRLGYRNVLIGNTIGVGAMIMLFGVIGPNTPIWQIVAQALVYGVLVSLQFTSMNTLVYADVAPDRASRASSIASTAQQLSISFGVAVAGLTTVFFLDARHGNAQAMVGGLHHAFLTLGLFTIASTLVFRRLTRGDGAEETQQKDIHLG